MPLPIAIGNTATAFADGEFTVAAGTPASLFITGATSGQGAPGGVQFEIAFKNAAGGYNVLRTLDASNIQDFGTINPPATYAARRLPSTSGSAGLELKA